MKYVILGVVFVAVPYILLTTFVKPALESLQQFYGTAGTVADQAAAHTGSQESKPVR